MPSSTRAKSKRRRYLVDEKGKRTAVVLPIEDYEELIEAAEQLDDIRHLERAKRVRGRATGWEQVKDDLKVEGKLP